MKDLSSSLQAGDLSGAQAAFKALTTNAPQNAAAKNSPFAKDMSAIGAALQSGDVAGAQKAFVSLQADMQARRAQHAAPTQASQSDDSDGDSDGPTGALNLSA